MPPASPRGGGRSKQTLLLPIGPEPDSAHSNLVDDPSVHAIRHTLGNDTVHSTSLLSQDRRRIWVHGPRPEYKKNSQRYNLPSRMTGLVRPNLDVVILPGGHAPTAEFWEFNRQVLGLEEWQVSTTARVCR